MVRKIEDKGICGFVMIRTTVEGSGKICKFLAKLKRIRESKKEDELENFIEEILKVERISESLALKDGSYLDFGSRPI